MSVDRMGASHILGTVAPSAEVEETATTSRRVLRVPHNKMIRLRMTTDTRPLLDEESLRLQPGSLYQQLARLVTEPASTPP